MADIHTPESEERVRRFSTYRIVEHLVLMAAFTVLVATGLPQKFYSFGISQGIIIALGGIDNVRWLHHAAGVLLGLLAAEHILVNLVGIVFLRWEPSMLITLKDPQDALQNMRYYLGLADSPAMCGRFTYKEKWIYWLILLGSFQMAVTGLVLWFPVIVTKYFPGQFIPASKVIHSNEAMLIFLLVVTWHIYDSVLSPDVFPLNRSIFSGYTTRKKMRQRHPLELGRVREPEKGQLDGSSAESPT